ncbi:MAG: outer membrane beta-barrel protein [Bacteroidales bacterium]
MRKGSLYLIFAGLFLLVSADVFSQIQKPKNDSWYDDKPLHFGFSLGTNLMDFDITPSQEYLAGGGNFFPEVSFLNPGINIQTVINWRPAKYIDLRFLPGVSFGQRSVHYYDSKDTIDPKYEAIGDIQRLQSSFLEFPLLVKFKGDRLNNVRPYVIGGLNYRYDLAGKKEYEESKLIYLRLKRPDLYYEAGAGLDFYLPYFKLSVEIKTSRGLRDVVVHDQGYPGYSQYLDAIEKMQSRIWVVSFHFE